MGLIPRFYDVQEGEVLVDGVNVKDYDLKDLRRKIGYVPQKALLFKGTIAENIRFGDDSANDEPGAGGSRHRPVHGFYRG